MKLDKSIFNHNKKTKATVMKKIIIISICLFLSTSVFSQIQESTEAGNLNLNKPERLEWFKELGFGMFIHFSFDSQLGVVISHSMAGASQDYLDRFVNELPKTFNPKEFADNLKKWGGFIPGIRPGEPTRQYIEWVLNRITFFGALFIVAIAIMPSIAQAQFNVPFYFGGTAILIVVGVALDTVGQIQAHAMSRNYEPLMKGKKIKGRWFNVGS